MGEPKTQSLMRELRTNVNILSSKSGICRVVLKRGTLSFSDSGTSSKGKNKSKTKKLDGRFDAPLLWPPTRARGQIVCRFAVSCASSVQCCGRRVYGTARRVNALACHSIERASMVSSSVGRRRATMSKIHDVLQPHSPFCLPAPTALSSKLPPSNK